MNQATATLPEPPVRHRKARSGMALKLGTITPELRRQAAAVLEVLAGVRTPTDAAKDLALSIPAYYKLEARAVRGLILACRPPGRGPRPAPEAEANRLRKQCHKLQQELGRYQALARSAQRAAGLPAPPSPIQKDGRGRRKRKPAIRAFRALAALREVPEAVPPAPACPPTPAAAVAAGAVSVR